MFTGLVSGRGTVVVLERDGGLARVRVQTPLAQELAHGDSIAINGVCVTAIELGPDRFAAEVIRETLARSTLGDLGPGDRVNLELPLRAGDRLGGHMVLGHVDGVAEVRSLSEEGELEIALDEGLCRYIVEKGSVALDGVSLTVAAVGADSLRVALIPATLQSTTLGEAAPGRRLNVEVDILAKHVEKLVAA